MPPAAGPGGVISCPGNHRLTAIGDLNVLDYDRLLATIAKALQCEYAVAEGMSEPRGAAAKSSTLQRVLLTHGVRGRRHGQMVDCGKLVAEHLLE